MSEVNRLGAIPIPVSVTVCTRKLSLAELLKWVPGSVVPFDQLATARMTICAGGQEVGEGHAVKIGTRAGFLVTRIESSHVVATDR